MKNKRQPAGFTKAVRIETQEAAKFNFHRRMREQEELAKHREHVAKLLQEDTQPTKVEPNRVGKKGK